MQTLNLFLCMILFMILCIHLIVCFLLLPLIVILDFIQIFVRLRNGLPLAIWTNHRLRNRHVIITWRSSLFISNGRLESAWYRAISCILSLFYLENTSFMDYNSKGKCPELLNDFILYKVRLSKRFFVAIKHNSWRHFSCLTSKE